MDFSTTLLGDLLTRKAKAGLVGLELEMEFNDLSPIYTVEDGNPPGPGGNWETVEDGSLRVGVESRLRLPVSLPKLGEQLDLYTSWLEKNSKKVKAVPSIRCSTHVHINMSRRTMLEVFRSIYASWAVENGLMMTQSTSRHNNIYCIPVARSPELVYEVTENILRSRFSPPILIREANRYAATNLVPLGTFGSIEYRFFDGTTDMSRVHEWVRTLAGLVDRASEISIEKQEEMISQSPDKYLDTLLEEFAEPVRKAVNGRVDDTIDLTGFARQKLKSAVDEVQRRKELNHSTFLVDHDLGNYPPVQAQAYEVQTDT